MRLSKRTPQLNAGSMADIAFLLLIFFLVTATISSDEGINRKLATPCPPNEDCNLASNNRNILRIIINNDDNIMLGEDVVLLENIKYEIKTFIDNNGDNTCSYCNGKQAPHASDNPREAIIALQHGKQTSYKRYIAVQNELTKAYHELRLQYCMKVLDKTYNQLNETDLKQIKEAYPFRVSEAETK
ncbi:biopolymer transporter ExbD [Tamlana fucoidanivorans]|uniref:Biopolymer transporter ExbD n=1 Tax=Allotamlana fucoidanivorans TaxID=2583814 RepID=A0A5C4SDQ0_9FLAO|nr:biopolymer transporter ExbD [Tamlana fucoidanivorans]TNJ41686.1 biopolymer transporter ExbD [Tamlana fucoidanivorans]